MMLDESARHWGCLLGLACGDAVGTTVEFKPRGSFDPITDMVGGGPFRLPVGAWTDDTSMALCLATSLIEMGRFDATDQMRRYCLWMETGHLSSTGTCFDIGITTRNALDRFRKTGEPYSGPVDPNSAGNGCIMRLAPVPMFFSSNPDQAIHWSGESSRTTHGSGECIEACRLLAAILCRALSGATKEDVLSDHVLADLERPKIQAIAQGGYRRKSESEIQSSGYVVHCLEAALWSFERTSSFREAVLLAVNLGDDADTTGAVCGQIAGAFYGEPGIPTDWVQQLVMGPKIRSWADQLGRGSRG